MDEIRSHHFVIMVETIVCRGIIIPGFFLCPSTVCMHPGIGPCQGPLSGTMRGGEVPECLCPSYRGRVLSKRLSLVIPH